MWQDNYSFYLSHHGILGQKWGKRNDPPYPLGSSSHSASEKKAGWRKSLDKSAESSHTKSSSSRNPVLSKWNRLVAIGKAKVDAMLGKTAGSVAGDKIDSGRAKVESMAGQKLRGTINGIKMLPEPESLEDTLKNANPHLEDDNYSYNCTLCSITSFLRQRGYNVIAGQTGGKPQNLSGIVERCFKGVKVLDGSAIKFGKSRQDAAEMLLKRFGDNAEGVCSIQWKSGGGHAFNWKIKDGMVSFFDGQKGRDDSIVSRYWSKGLIDPNGSLQLARLDGLEIDFDAIKEMLE